jgi:hypothetical protein
MSLYPVGMSTPTTREAQMCTQAWIMRTGLIALLVAGGAPAVGGYGSSNSRSVPPATLRCLFYELPRPNTHDFTGGLSCQVTGATSAETSFTLTYRLNGAECRGTMTRRSGSCTVSFLLNGPLESLGTVAGELLPSHRPLGPVAPSPAP